MATGKGGNCGYKIAVRVFCHDYVKFTRHRCLLLHCTRCPKLEKIDHFRNLTMSLSDRPPATISLGTHPVAPGVG